jgi:hypothetical protein
MVVTAKDGLKMAKKPIVSYAGLSLSTDQGTAESVSTPEVKPLSERRPDRAGGRTLKEVSEPVMLYLNPAAAKALKRYALDQDVKVHDLLIEAVENWFRSHGLRESVRAVPLRRRSGANRQEGNPSIA